MHDLAALRTAMATGVRATAVRQHRGKLMAANPEG